MTSGERNAGKQNPKRVASIGQKLSRVKKALDELKNKPNKSVEDNIELGKLRAQVKHLSKKRSARSELHARKGERH
jgi:small-conductance mechanosensitive channel